MSRGAATLLRCFLSKQTYLETFDQHRGGWWGWLGNDKGFNRLQWETGVVTARSPWWIDYNHAPPGAGYLHMLFCLNTKGPFSDHHKDIADDNRYVAAGCPLDFRNARITLRVRGELRERGAHMVLLLQGTISGITAGWLLTGQPFAVTPEWNELTAVATQDPKQWTCLRGRHDRLDYYNYHPLEAIVGNVNVNLMLVLFPLMVIPMGPLKSDPNVLRAGKDYPVWASALPEGYIELDTVKIDFADNT